MPLQCCPQCNHLASVNDTVCAACGCSLVSPIGEGSSHLSSAPAPASVALTIPTWPVQWRAWLEDNMSSVIAALLLVGMAAAVAHVLVTPTPVRNSPPAVPGTVSSQPAPVVPVNHLRQAALPATASKTEQRPHEISWQVTLTSPQTGASVLVGTRLALPVSVSGPSGNPALVVFARKTNQSQRQIWLTRKRQSTAIWTPKSAGRYTLVAELQAGRTTLAASNAVSLDIDVPAPAPQPLPKQPQAKPEPVRIATAAHSYRRTVIHRSVPRVPSPPRSPAPPPMYHVVAGVLRNTRSAAGLASALRARGYHIRTYTIPNGHSTHTVVETGVYSSKAAAQSAAKALQKFGYPAGTLVRPR